jgi:methylated-DNA-[protein]-cysteine S-methyltransferase
MMTETEPAPGLEEQLRDFEAPLTPPEQLPGWPPRAEIHFDVAELAVGRVMVSTRADGTVIGTVYLGPHDEDRVLDRLARVLSPSVVRGGPGPAAVLSQLEQYLAGHRREFDLDIDLSMSGSIFQRTVLEQLRARVAYGRSISYGELAAAVNRKGAARAVGSAQGANPVCILVPCHRVLAGSGRLSGYAGGAEAKQFLLDLEAAHA